MGKTAAVYAISGLVSGVLVAAPWPALAQECPLSTLQPLPETTTAANTLEMSAGAANLDAYGTSTLTGGVQLRFEDQLLETESMRYDHPARIATIESAVRFRSAMSQIEAESARFDLDNDTATFHQTQFSFSNGGRGGAERLQLATDRLGLYQVEYTTCDPSDPAWAIRGSEIRINAERGEGVARNMQLRFFDVPVLYLPWFRFPVSEDRQTGLLYPQMGSSDSTGFYLRWPVYLNLHPQADLTLTPEWLDRRGAVIGGEARGLWQAGQASVRTRWLSRDAITGERRYQWGGELTTRLFDRARAEMQYDEVSDIDFLRELGLDDSDSSTNVLERRLDLSWRPLTAVQVRTRVVNFQILDPDATSAVYTREPELSALYNPLRDWHGWRPQLGMELVRFASDGEQTTARYDANAQLNWEHLARGWEMQASGGWRYTRYDAANASVQERDLPSIRAGVGLNLLRSTRSGNVQTLRPRLDYLYTPYRDQASLPVFDTSLPDFSLDQLRSNNRFSGIDRISDENTLIPSVESSILDPVSGIRRARFRLGVQYRLSESSVTLPDETSGRSGASDWLLETDVDAANGIRGRAAGQYNTEESRFDALSVGGRYLGNAGERLQLAYRFRRDLFEQIDTLVLWPLGGRWRGAVHWVWALDENRSQETLAGLSYQSCCWGVTAGMRRYVNGTVDDYDTGVFLQLAFRGLGNFGRGFGDIFDRDALSF